MSERSDSDRANGVREAAAFYASAPIERQTDSVPAGYKRTEVGIIPEGWNSSLLGELFSFSNGINADKSAYGHGVPFINVLEPIKYSHIREIDIPGKVSVPSRLSKNCSVKYGDIVFNRTSEVQEEVGFAAVYIDENPVVFGGFVICAKPIRKNLDPVYAGYALRAPAVRSQIVAKAQGAIRSNIGQASLRGVVVPIPQVSEQCAIATALSDTDALIDALGRLIAKKRAIKQGAMQQLLTGQTRLPGFTCEWETQRLGEVANIRSGGTPSTTIPAFWNGGIPWCTPTDITALGGHKYLAETERTISHEGLQASSAESIPPKSIIMTTRATIGECAINAVSMTTNQGFKNLVPTGVDAEFLYYLMTTKKNELIKICGGSTFLEISKKQLYSFDLIFTKSYQEQQAIATVLSEMDAEIEALEHRRDKARQIKQGMMQELLTGRTRLVEPEALP